MTWFGPSPERGPGTQPTKLVSEFSVRICYIQYYNVFNRKGGQSYGLVTVYTVAPNITSTMLRCVQSKEDGQIYRQGQWPNVTSKYHTLPESVLSSSTECSYRQGSGPVVFVYIMWPHWKETISHFCDTLEIEEMSVLWNFSYPYPYPETSLTLGTPR